MADDSPHADPADPPPEPGSDAAHARGRVGSPTPNARSCITCRRRKVKCNKKHPCSNCARAHSECVFPGPGRKPRTSRKPHDAELLDRLRRLEGVVAGLNAQVEEHELEAAAREKQAPAEASCPYADTTGRASVAVDESVAGLENRFGRLVVEKGRSRYVNNSFWASLNNEVEDLSAILIQPSDDDDDGDDGDDNGDADLQPPASSRYASQHQGFVFGYSSTDVDLHALHPCEQHARDFWATYKENVDPLVKVLHVPTFEPAFLDAVSHVGNVPKGLECLLFAIYYGAVTSTTPEECLERWADDRSSLLGKYRFALEQALARANFLHCDEMVILQAFVVFLILLRRNDEARKIWTLTGLVVRIAQTLGIHRDGSHFKLPPFEIEMRRRLWWQVCILDARASEDHGCDPTIVEAQFDTKMPLNANDADLRPDMTDFPEEHNGFTDMTFCLLRFEVANIFRRILYVPPGPNRCTDFFADLSIAEKEKWITECHARMEEKYLQNMDMTIPLCWVTATISRLIMSKMWLIVYHPHQRKDGGATLPQETKDKLFITSLENIEYSILLESEARTMKWGWLFRTYVQWHAIAFLLSELCVRTRGEAVERAWRALEATAGRWWFPLNSASPHGKGQQGYLWKPLRKLLAKARAAREKDLALERASLALGNGPTMYPGFANGVDPMTLPPVTVYQSSSDELDQLLRPSAPKLGESPTSNQPSWPTSPSMPNTQRSFPTGFEAQNTPSQTDSAGFNNMLRRNGSPAQDFTDLSNFGLDHVVNDVMNDVTFDGNWVYNSLDYSGNTSSTVPNLPVPMQPPGIQAVNAFAQPNAINGTANANNFNDIPLTTMGEAAVNPPTHDSPTMDGGSMDWTMWDDLVTQYGLEGAQPNPNTNPASHMGLVHWF
ncbi:fungal-specific transcription factor domain-containing protein [Ampelomyces quisqualis]|uniref:Fungal-specific transcription factor domain-containing protein n=1 Tax=Ampelomyces quisqualis TaxID=50730 RepID=A0A6A5QPA5_AMPQU|nr:fungal-specific transcription factor domain-containing protein [Ampelomyces quisqualis]